MMLARTRIAAAGSLKRMLTSNQQLQLTHVSQRWASTLVVSEPLVDGATPAGTQSTVTAAAQLNTFSAGNTIGLLVVGDVPPSRIPSGVDKVYFVPSGGHVLSETVASAIEHVATSKDCTVVMGTSSKFGSTVIPRAAALLDVSPVTDILEIQNESKCYCARFVGKISSILRWPLSLRLSVGLV
jgi:electron transfer flavoprotein alpha subunit